MRTMRVSADQFVRRKLRCLWPRLLKLRIARRPPGILFCQAFGLHSAIVA
jgi:hypothetical protein